MRRSTAAGTHGVNLMPLLDVLLCTMGTLIVILGVINREARLHPAKRVPGKAAQQQQELIDAKEDIQLRIDELTTARKKTLADVEASRQKLAGIEDSSRQMEDQLQSLVAAGKQLKASASDDPQRDLLRSKLAQLNAQRLQLEKDLQHARMDSANRQSAYAVVPFEGMYKTNRRPIYIECRDDCVILQPEGIVFGPGDFLGPGGPSNPLASALRAAQEYWRQAPRPAPDLPNEPYPLLLVRPDGIIAYYLVRDAMSSWDAEFGYELVGQDWKLEFPMQTEPQLKNQEERAVADARQQLQWLAKISPELFSRKASKVEYHVSPFRGGVVRDGGPSLGSDPFADDPLGGFGRTGVRGGNGNFANGGNNPNGMQAYGGNVSGRSLGGNSAFGSGPSGNGGFGQNGAGNGLNSGDRYSSGSNSGPAGNGLTGTGPGGNGLAANGPNGAVALTGPAGSSGLGDGPGFPGDQTSGSGSSNYLNNGATGSGTGSGNGPEFANIGPRYAGTGNGTNGFGNGSGSAGSNGNSKSGGGASNTTNGNMANGNNGSGGSGSPSEYGGVQLPASASGPLVSGMASNGSGMGSPGAGLPATAGSTGSMGSAGSSPGAPGNQYQYLASSGSRGGGPYSADGNSGSSSGSAGGSGGVSSSSGGDSSGGSSSSSMMGSPGSNSEMPSGSPSMSFDLTPQQQQNASYDPATQQQSSSSHSMAKNRGRNWALPTSHVSSVPIQRPIRVECWPDRLVLVPDTRDLQPQVIPLGARTEDAVEPLVGAVRTYTKSWGIAGRSMYWKPQLVLNVNPNAEARAADLQTLLADSGWDVRRK
ncbi:MAG TPA: hypothetical protein VFE46_17475 [Pirellulales bacterium]|jgi:biopolymer transport protein ExbD|nr:hypothetical protein [Pirellulales bacterium]